MVIFVHSLGSLWQEKLLPTGGVRIWNTTGIRDGLRVRSCAEVFGQVKFGVRARTELSGSKPITGALWTASGSASPDCVRKVALLCRAPQGVTPALYLVTVSEGLVGQLDHDSFDVSQTAMISFSKWRSRQEVMLLMQPFAWLRGSEGSAVLIADGGRCNWEVRRW
jgi:hypothetical protein